MSFNSLYYSSIGLPECFRLFLATFNSPKKAVNVSRELKSAINLNYPNSEIFAFSTGRGALSAGLEMARLQPGDEVILSSFTCLAVPTAVIAAGASPVYVDIESVTLNTKVQVLKDAITDKTKAIVIQHTFGNPADVIDLVELLKDRNILIIEDCALSVGTKINNGFAGSFAHAAILSFELSKTLSVGWGGLLLINDKKYFRGSNAYYDSVAVQSRVVVLKDVFQTIISAVCHRQGFYFIGKYIIYTLFKLGLFRYSTTETETNLNFGSGFIYKLNRPFTSLLLHQWKRLNTISQLCNSNYLYLRKAFLHFNYSIPDQNSITEGEIFKVASRISVLTKNRQEFISFFNKRGIEVGLWFDGPLTPVPPVDSFNYRKELYPNSNFIAEHIVNLPCHSRLSSPDLENIVSAIEEFAVLYPQGNLNTQ